MFKWLKNLDPNKDLKEATVKSIEHNLQFVRSLDARQQVYYANLHDSWRKEMTRLEKRIFELEQK